eukprot:CAMPEP_0119412590 /NCGR_PEP_ID=MMETSP1335-20130426/4981_1 /TAXON_ID=259385 /ORGANISM="Chrysoculter rhomboideus, Strain RCC1486" /LENGTH=287 /DNA_ID=CAMNT_0007437343 /DNA_START=42 /DNA_END=905 /DNA_ORIENTATION=-
MSLLVTRLDGSTLCVNTGGVPMRVSALMDAIAASEGVPPSEQRLVRAGKELRAGPNEPLLSGALPAVTLCLRVCGGKGGFGANLRSKALMAGQKKTTNFDACRDLNGVRLKAVQNEKKIAEWRAKQEAKARKNAAAGGGPSGSTATPPHADASASNDAVRAFELNSYYEANEARRNATASAVAKGLQAKRQREELEETVREAAALVRDAVALEHAPAGLTPPHDAPAAANGAPAKVARAAAPGVPVADAPALSAIAARKAPAVAARCANKWSVLDEPSSGDDEDSDQ